MTSMNETLRMVLVHKTGAGEWRKLHDGHPNLCQIPSLNSFRRCFFLNTELTKCVNVDTRLSQNVTETTVVEVIPLTVKHNIHTFNCSILAFQL